MTKANDYAQFMEQSVEIILVDATLDLAEGESIRAERYRDGYRAHWVLAPQGRKAGRHQIMRTNSHLQALTGPTVEDLRLLIEKHAKHTDIAQHSLAGARPEAEVQYTQARGVVIGFSVTEPEGRGRPLGGTHRKTEPQVTGFSSVQELRAEAASRDIASAIRSLNGPDIFPSYGNDPATFAAPFLGASHIRFGGEPLVRLLVDTTSTPARMRALTDNSLGESEVLIDIVKTPTKRPLVRVSAGRKASRTSNETVMILLDLVEHKQVLQDLLAVDDFRVDGRSEHRSSEGTVKAFEGQGPRANGYANQLAHLILDLYRVD